MGEHKVRKSAVFLDRDGVLNRPVIRDGLPFPPASADEFSLYPDVVEGCAQLKHAGFLLVVVTNQPDVGRGTQTREAVDAINAALLEALPVLDGIEVCFHGGRSLRRTLRLPKAETGNVAACGRRDSTSICRGSFLIGDRWRDVDCAHAAGCRSVFIDHGYREALREEPDYIVATFHEAVSAILDTICAKPVVPLTRVGTSVERE